MSLGFEFRILNTQIGFDAFKDIHFFIKQKKNAVFFDVGANNGQSIADIQSVFLEPIIHAFEPGKKAFAELSKDRVQNSTLKLNPIGLGAKNDKVPYYETSSSDMNSFLQPGKTSWTKLENTFDLEIQTLDSYCKENNISYIDVLKMDTQGYELEVLKGAQNMLDQGKINAIFLEIIFSEMYVGAPSMDQIYIFLTSRGYKLVTFYQQHYQNDILSWTDALFIKA